MDYPSLVYIDFYDVVSLCWRRWSMLVLGSLFISCGNLSCTLSSARWWRRDTAPPTPRTLRTTSAASLLCWQWCSWGVYNQGELLRLTAGNTTWM